MSTDYAEPDYDFSGSPKAVEIIEAPGFPPPRHPAEADLFARHEGVPGHVQDALTNARIVIVGAGGLGSWVALALARSGVRSLTIIDPDRYDRTNASRQLMFASDIGQPKAVALARNLADHMIAGGVLSAIAMSFQNAIQAHAVPADLLVVAVDNNGCRWAASRIARQLRIPHARAYVRARSSPAGPLSVVRTAKSRRGAGRAMRGGDNQRGTRRRRTCYLPDASSHDGLADRRRTFQLARDRSHRLYRRRGCLRQSPARLPHVFCSLKRRIILRWLRQGL